MRISYIYKIWRDSNLISTAELLYHKIQDLINQIIKNDSSNEINIIVR